jgi:hypothetical protein
MDQKVTEILTQISAQAVTYVSYFEGGEMLENVKQIMLPRQCLSDN